jgi:uncharacterized protein
MLAKLVDNVANTCAASNDCRHYLVVEANGDVFPCDFHVRPEWHLGNIHADDWQSMLSSNKFAAFGARKKRCHVDCAICQFKTFCQGDCPKNRCAPNGDSTQRSRLCEGWKMFYAHALPRLKELAQDIRRTRQQESLVSRHAAAGLLPGRNDPCLCGSGRKFKQCCGRPV